MLKKQFLLFLLIGAFSLHLTHQLIPHHHHYPEEIIALHSHESGIKHHHHNSTSACPEPDVLIDLLGKLLSFINHGNTENPIQSGNQLKADFCKTISIVLSGGSGLQGFSLFAFNFFLPVYSPPKEPPTKHIILFKSRRGPPALG